jgi:hypothetical protein
MGVEIVRMNLGLKVGGSDDSNDATIVVYFVGFLVLVTYAKPKI